MWESDPDDDYQQTQRCIRFKELIEFERCCMCIKIPTAVKILCLIDLILFTWFSVFLLENFTSYAFFFFFLFAILLPTCSAVILFLISRENNTARSTYYVTWIIRYVYVVFVTGIYASIKGFAVIGENICANFLSVTAD